MTPGANRLFERSFQGKGNIGVLMVVWLKNHSRGPNGFREDKAGNSQLLVPRVLSVSLRESRFG